MIEFALGIIIGLLVNPFRQKVADEVKKAKDKYAKTQFVEPVDMKKRWIEADSFNDILD